MRPVAYVLSVALVAVRRLWRHRGLAASMLLGLTVAVALAVSVPIYADAVSGRILEDRLYANAENPGPPFALLFRYVGSWHGFREREEFEALDRYIVGQAGQAVGLPQRLAVRYVKTDSVELLPTLEAAYAEVGEALAYVSLGFMSDLESHINILEGSFPSVPTGRDQPLDVLVTTDLVGRLGLGTGEVYVANYEGEGSNRFQRKVRIAGIWEAADAAEEYWLYPQSALQDVLLMPEASYAHLAQEIRGEVGLAAWWLVFEPGNLRSREVAGLLARLGGVEARARSLLYEIDIPVSPAEALSEYQHTMRSLTVALYAFSVPIMGLVIYFGAVVAGVVVRRQRNEIASLRSRGASLMQAVGMYLVELFLVGVPGVALGLVLGERVALFMRLSRSFLAFRGGAASLYRLWTVPIDIWTLGSWPNLGLGLGVAVVFLGTTLVPVVRYARDTVVTYKQERARVLRDPLWKRAYLDVALILPGLYGYYLLRRRGSLSFLPSGGEKVNSPFENPYLFLVPVLVVFGLTLLYIRLFPPLMRLLSWMANGWRGAVPVLVLRQLARLSGQYVAPMSLLILTLSLAVFTASMAATLDAQGADAIYYDVGADVRLVELGESASAGPATTPTGETAGEEQLPGPEWLFLPVSEHERIPRVRHATRVLVREVDMHLGSDSVAARLMGIDRIDFPQVAFFRRDFASASLGALMNALAVRDDALLVSRDVAEQGIEVGDKLEVTIPLGSEPEVSFAVGGVVDYFPGLYAEEGPFLIANLDFIFDSVGGVYPYDVWLTVDGSLSSSRLAAEAARLGFEVVKVHDARERVDVLERRPERQGVLGLLSVGFAASALLTVLGFLIYAYVSFRQRYIELGVLRAIGLSVSQMGLFLVSEQLSLIALGTTAGTALGVLTSRMFLPYYHVQAGKYLMTPPLIVQIAWDKVAYIYAVFGVMFVVAAALMLWSLRRLRVFEVIKLGETT